MAFVYCADNNVVDLLLVSIVSLRRKTNDKIYVLENNIDKLKIIKIKENISNIHFISISKMLEKNIITNDGIDRDITTTSMGWIFSAELLNEKRIAILDCDTLIISSDINLYKEIDLEDKTFAGVPETISSFSFKRTYQYDWIARTGKGFYEHSIDIGLNILEYNNYINSGFLIVDLEKMREKKYSEKMINWHKNNLNRLFNDQDIINSVAKSDIKLIDYRWNFCKPTFGSYWPEDDINKFKEFSKNAIIIHYAGKFAKPISENFDGTYPYKKEYIKIFNKIKKNCKFSNKI